MKVGLDDTCSPAFDAFDSSLLIPPAQPIRHASKCGRMFLTRSRGWGARVKIGGRTSTQDDFDRMKEICVLIAVTILGGGLAACGSGAPPLSPRTGASLSLLSSVKIAVLAA